ncbi:hypothetical protein ABEB36_006918 [Hypothenemus hampei]|uniref:ABC transporter domain-containing protein n=1 Tax=Hypothenemus hampei TaxID=57062 RepID=A0ABD1EW37_HYPHA
MSTLQLRAILWKNVIIRKKHWFLTICEIMIPVLLFIVVAYGRSNITGLSKQEIVNVTYNEKYPISYDYHQLNLEETQFYYSPNHEYFSDIVHRLQEKIQVVSNNVQGFVSEKNLQEQYTKSGNSTVIAIIFNSEPLSHQFDYTIRVHKEFFCWRTQQLFENDFVFSPNKESDYIWQGFLTIQRALDMSFIEKENEIQGGTLPYSSLQTQLFPYPPYKADSGISQVFMFYLPLITLFSFIFVCPAVIKRVVEEKESGIKELMKMVGMKSSILWFGWFVYSIFPMVFSVVFIVISMKVDLFGAGYPPIEYTNFGILFLFLLLYCVSIIAKCFFLSTLCSKPTFATIVGVLFWIFSYFLPKYWIDDNADMSICYSNVILMMLPNMLLHYGYTAISFYEVREIGVQWSNWHISGADDTGDITMMHVCIMFLLNTVVYFTAALYFDAIDPGQYGVGKSVWFPFLFIKNACKLRKKPYNLNTNEDCEEALIENNQFPVGIKLMDVMKYYGKKEVVSNLNLNIYQDQITVLMGHNGAGKSTTMGIITGMVKQSSGEISYNVSDASMHNIHQIQTLPNVIGYCPQYNLFFPDLTVAQHLRFFAMLKGRNCKEIDDELPQLLKKLNLTEKCNNLAKTLSGGMKRRLSLGIAVVGGSKILILDEPSSGLDLKSRRDMWDLLHHWRGKRTIVISTHCMDEADALGDWIAILNEGKLICHGTPMFLKEKYNIGSNLILSMEDNCNVELRAEEIETILKTFFCDIKCNEINGNEVRYFVPSVNLAHLYDYLNSNQKYFQIRDISFGSTTLEDLFINLTISRYFLKIILEQEVGRKENHDVKITSSHLTLFIPKILTMVVAVFILGMAIFLDQFCNNVSNGGPYLSFTLDSYDKSSVYFSNTIPGVDIQNLIPNQYNKFHSVENVPNAIVTKGIENLPFYRHHLIAAMELRLKENYKGEQELEATALYNGWAIHSAPISVNLVTNIFAKLLLGQEYSITTSINPLPSNNKLKSPNEISETQMGILWLFVLPLAFLFFISSFIYFPHAEFSTNFSNLQFMCRVHPMLYWFTTFVFDFSLYMIFSFIMTVIIALSWDPFKGINQIVSFYWIVLLYGLNGIPFCYLFTKLKSFANGYSLFVISSIFCGNIITILVLALEESQNTIYIDIGLIFKWIFRCLCPHFQFTYSGVIFARKAVSIYNFDHYDKLKVLSICSSQEPNVCCNRQSTECSLYRISYLPTCLSDLFLALLFAVTYLLMNWIWSIKIWNTMAHIIQIIKQIFSKKKSDLKNNQAELSILKIDDLQKKYNKDFEVEINDFQLKQDECVGFLGVNGAGKSTMFRILTKEEVRNKGDIKINGINIDDDKYLSHLGYCPQNDALNNYLTGREILKTMVKLKNLNEDVVEMFIDVFDFAGVADIPCGQYSGGNKRKLSLAIALLGFPAVILLDEPTNGVDPLNRHKFWRLIKEIKKLKRSSFMFTSHNMTECEKLCDRLNIMRGGKIEGNDTIMKLKQKSPFVNVKLKLRSDQNSQKDINNLKNELKKFDLNEKIKDEHKGLLHFYIKSPKKNWTELFNIFENLKNENNVIEAYSLSHASLEDVFFDFTDPER